MINSWRQRLRRPGPRKTTWSSSADPDGGEGARRVLLLDGTSRGRLCEGSRSSATEVETGQTGLGREGCGRATQRGVSSVFSVWGRRQVVVGEGGWVGGGDGVVCVGGGGGVANHRVFTCTTLHRVAGPPCTGASAPPHVGCRHRLLLARAWRDAALARWCNGALVVGAHSP